MKRRILAFALSALMVLSLCGAMLVSAKPAYAFVENGSPFTFDNATYQKYKITSGWRGAGDDESLPITVDAVALEFDPADGLIPMAFSGYSGTSAVCSEQYRIAAEKYGYDVVGVINGSFFSMDSDHHYGAYGTLVGDLISDGKVASAHAGFSGSVVAFGSDGSMNIVDSSLAYTLSVNGKEIPGGMYYINKTSGTNEAGKGQWKNGFYYYDTSCGRVCDTSEYVTGYEVLCRKLDHTDLIVGSTLRGEVISVTPNTSGGAVGEKDKLSDQFILFVKTDSPNAAYVKDLKAGDSVNIAVEETVEESREIMEKANSVITNVGWLVRDGEDLTMSEEKIGTHDVTMMARWTAFGTKPDGSFVFFTTDSVEDEAQYHTGDSYCVTLRDVAKAMMSMGCTNVIRMDGGGSTAMYVKNTGSGSAGYLMSSTREVGDCILVVKRSSMNRDKTAKADLQALVESLKSDDRTACKEVVAEAKTVLEATTSTSSDFVRAYVSVKAVVNAFASLDDMIEAAEKADQKDYAYTIWNNIQQFLSAAKQIRDDKTVGAAAVISAVTSLTAELNKTGDYDVNVAQGCSYEHGIAPDEKTYPDTDNKELTDGDWSVDTDGKASGWVGFGGGKGAKVTIDLGALNKGLSSFRCRALKITSWGISFPSSMKVEVSADGESFTSVGSVPLSEEAKSLPDNSGFTLQLDLANGVSARYVRFTVSGSGWTFLSEMEVIRHEKAGEIPKSGKIGGSDTYWDLEEGTLTISGEGSMPDFVAINLLSSSFTNEEIICPWEVYLDSITKIVVEEGVTKVGANAFAGCENVAEVTLAASVDNLGAGAFEGCVSIETVTVKAEEPPKYDIADVVGGSEGAEILVPAGSEEAYKEAWEEYADDIETDPETKPEFKKGDIDGDGYVTITDYLMVKAQVLETKEFTEEQKARMDVTGEGDIDIFDYLQIKKIVLEQ